MTNPGHMMTRREPDLWPTILAALVGSVVAVSIIGGLIGGAQ